MRINGAAAMAALLGAAWGQGARAQNLTEQYRGAADKLIASATLVEGEAVDLYHFTSVIMRSVDDAGRLRIVEMMWELVYADGDVSEFEDNVVWRAADLLGVSSRDRLDLKHRIAEKQASLPKGPWGVADATT